MGNTLNFNRKMTPAERERTRAAAAANESAGYKLFHRKFKVTIPAAYLYTEEDFARGVVITGDRKSDMQSAHELVAVFMPIVCDDTRWQPNILEFFEQQIPNFMLTTPEDTKEVYDIIQQHFKDKAQELREVVNISRERKERVMRDLERLNALSSFLHEPVHTALPKHLHHDSLDNQLRRVLDPRLQTGPSPEEKQAAAEAAAAIPQYEGYESKLGMLMALKRTKRWSER